MIIDEKLKKEMFDFVEKTQKEYVFDDSLYNDKEYKESERNVWLENKDEEYDDDNEAFEEYWKYVIEDAKMIDMENFIRDKFTEHFQFEWREFVKIRETEITK
jgi:hypothetical protein